MAGELYRRFDAFRTRIGHKGHRIIQERGNFVEFLAQLYPLLVIVVSGNVDKFFGLLLDRFHHLRVTVAGCDNGNPGREIQETVAIHIPHFSSFSMIHHKRVAARIRRGNNGLVALNNGPRLRPGQVHDLHTSLLLV
jgi:hypothetical protein